jgi:hypothetical protein
VSADPPGDGGIGDAIEGGEVRYWGREADWVRGCGGGASAGGGGRTNAPHIARRRRREDWGALMRTSIHWM